MKQLRAGIIGQGRSGRDIHGKTLSLISEKYRIVAVCDLIPDRRSRAEEEYGCVSYADYRDLLARDDLDFIINASPSHLHAPISVEIMEAGFHCVSEKPMAPDTTGARQMIDTAEKTDRILIIYQQSRFAPYFMKVREVIESGVLGRIVQINIAFNGFARRYDWQTLQEFAGGNLLNTGPHPLDQALQLFGEKEEPRVTCVMERVNTAGDAEDHVLLVLSGEASPTVRLEISSCCAYPVPVYSVYAENGGLTGTMESIEWKYLEPDLMAAKPRLQREPLRHNDGTPAYPREELRWIEGSWTVPEAEGDLFATINGRFYGMLYDVLVNRTPPVITPKQVLRQIAVIEECKRQNPSIYAQQ
jgi:scyllo-inositol 2-dehydrogenase (NADP+)